MTTTVEAAAAKMAGTSLEVLAPYFPYGVEVEYLPRPYRAKIHTLGQTTLKLFGHDPELWIKDCVPYLRPFSALCTPLSDGTVPAVEIAKMAMGSPHFTSKETPNARIEGESLVVSFGKMETPFLIMGVDTWAMAWVDSDKDINPVVDQVGIIDQLRAWGFALPVNGRPLIEGTDYLPK